MSVATTQPRVDELARAAEVCVRTALQLQAGERLVLVHDRVAADAARALVHCARALGAEVRAVDLAKLGRRPLPALPDWVAGALENAHASVFIASALPGELGLRQQVLHRVRQLGLRHAHMPGISTLAFCRGQRIDYDRVAQCGERVLAKLRGARQLEVHSPSGTALHVELAESCRWFAQLGRLAPGRWGNLPAGALYASPARVDGVFAVDASLGEYFGAREGQLGDRPVQLRIESSRVVAVHAPGAAALEREIGAMLHFAENSDRVGLVALGVNYGIEQATGEALVDQNLPGLHLAVGDPAARVTGATWSARTSFAACGAHATVLVDGVPVTVRGKLLATN
ncbi:MAG: aminopeptidase [Polyangiaceae bacterium]|nr:aminopeptidase [Polyangiaceae bacterium]